MIKFLTILTACLFLAKNSKDDIEKLKLSDQEVPAGYFQSKDNNCISIQACTFYDNPEMYEMLIGKIRSKQIQNFDSKKDKGAIMYFEFEEDFKAEAFLGGLLWGGSKPTTEHPEEFYSKGRYLVIWSFKKGSPLSKVSQDKVKAALN